MALLAKRAKDNREYLEISIVTDPHIAVINTAFTKWPQVTESSVGWHFLLSTSSTIGFNVFRASTKQPPKVSDASGTK